MIKGNEKTYKTEYKQSIAKFPYVKRTNNLRFKILGYLFIKFYLAFKLANSFQEKKFCVSK